MHTYTPYLTLGWSPVYGPLAYGSGLQQPMLEPLDSGRVVLGWREPRSASQDVYYRRFDRGAWEVPQGPIASVTAGGWPLTLLYDPVAARLLTLWENSTPAGPRVQYREAALRGAWDSSDHLLAGPDSGGSSEPLAIQESSGNAMFFWVGQGALHSRTRYGLALAGTPPLIIPPSPAAAHLGASRPNPMSPRTVIPFEVPASLASAPVSRVAGSGVIPPAAPPAKMRLSIHDAAGRAVRVLIDAARDPGRYEVEWDGRLESGARAPAGVYFYRLDLGAGRVETRKLLLLR